MNGDYGNRHAVSVYQPLDPEVVAFRAQFDQKSPLDELEGEIWDEVGGRFGCRGSASTLIEIDRSQLLAISAIAHTLFEIQSASDPSSRYYKVVDQGIG